MIGAIISLVVAAFACEEIFFMLTSMIPFNGEYGNNIYYYGGIRIKVLATPKNIKKDLRDEREPAVFGDVTRWT